MAGGRQRDQWARAAAAMALFAEAHRDRKKRPRPFSAADFDPFADKRPAGRRGMPVKARHVESLARLLVDGPRPRPRKLPRAKQQ